jgi:hypothetical protein
LAAALLTKQKVRAIRLRVREYPDSTSNSLQTFDPATFSPHSAYDLAPAIGGQNSSQDGDAYLVKREYN